MIFAQPWDPYFQDLFAKIRKAPLETLLNVSKITEKEWDWMLLEDGDGSDWPTSEHMCKFSDPIKCIRFAI